MKIETANPATGEKLKSYAEFSGNQVAAAIREADQAFQKWKQSSFAERSQKMKAAARVLLEEKENLAIFMAQEMGKPLAQGRAEIEKCAWVCDYYADKGEMFLSPEIIASDASKSFVAFEPLGIVLAIMPWNFPFWQAFRAAVPAITAGNAMILKHAANVTGCALAIEEIFRKAGCPAGLFRTVIVSSPHVAAIIENPLIKAVTLTGGTPAGKAVASKAGEFLKKCVLELGGSDPYIILEDADIEKAAETCAASRLINAGQSCIAAKRFLVAESVKKKFEEIFVKSMKAQKIGDPLEPGVTVGPLARHDLRDGIHKQVERTISQGAKLLLGGEIPKSKGAFYPPTILTDVTKGMEAFDNETFGPVATITRFRTEDEAIRLANDSIFGLGSAVFTKDIQRGEKIAHQLEAGSCFVNAYVKSDPRLPFGGVKDSGYGRELSIFGIREFVNIKTVFIQ